MKLTDIISKIRNAHPDNEWLYMQGQCYNFALILKAIRPDAEIHYSMLEGHVYTLIDGAYYDIRGKHHKVPKDTTLLCHKRGHKPHRWGKGDSRRLVDG